MLDEDDVAFIGEPIPLRPAAFNLGFLDFLRKTPRFVTLTASNFFAWFLIAMAATDFFSNLDSGNASVIGALVTEIPIVLYTIVGAKMPNGGGVPY